MTLTEADARVFLTEGLLSADLGDHEDAIENYVRDVGSGCFPGKGESFGMDPATLEEVLKK